MYRSNYPYMTNMCWFILIVCMIC